jgi:hypothetical protein
VPWWTRKSPRLCDFLSRAEFDNKQQIQFEQATVEAFARMDAQLDLHLKKVLSLPHRIEIGEGDHENSELKEFWNVLELGKTTLHENEVWFKTKRALFCKGKLVVPSQLLKVTLDECHKTSNHPGAERKLLFFLAHFVAKVPKSQVLEICKALVLTFEVCVLTKQSRPLDKGKIGSLPTPSV